LKVFNDPVYGFIEVGNNFLLKLIDHRFFQKSRRIKQLGVTEFVYPGAVHTRFQHAMGAMHLMGKALNTLRSKGITISDKEKEACEIAILLHDIGHGPFSHSLEEVLMPGIEHESISYQFMLKLNEEFDGRLNLALKIFRNSYERKFFHELVSSQLDMDRLDYLIRDSYFTGVPEGSINVERLIQLLNVDEDRLVLEEKAIYVVENFLSARRLMYWQVYLHKTSIGAEKIITNIIKRARDLYSFGQKIPMSPALEYFFANKINIEQLSENEEAMDHFSKLDDTDIWGSIKIWRDNKDPILSHLCNMILERKLLKVRLSNEPIDKSELQRLKHQVTKKFNVLMSDTHYFMSHGPVTNEAYILGGKPINIITKKEGVKDIAYASDLPNIQAISKIVLKYYQCWPKGLTL